MASNNKVDVTVKGKGNRGVVVVEEQLEVCQSTNVEK